MRPVHLLCLIAFCVTTKVEAQEFVYPVGERNERPTASLPNNNGYQISLAFGVGGHTGVDLDNRGEGGVVRSTSSGRVTYVCLWTRETCFGFGNVVIIRHDISGGPFYSLYAHLQDNSVLVSVGQDVAIGEPIGQVGSTGGPRVTGPHLHFAIKTENQLGCGYIAPGECNSEVGQESIYRDPLNFVAARRVPSSTLVTYTFTGRVLSVSGDWQPLLGGPFAVGQTYRGSFTYAPSTAAISFLDDCGNPIYRFDNGLTDFQLTVDGAGRTFRFELLGSAARRMTLFTLADDGFGNLLCSNKDEVFAGNGRARLVGSAGSFLVAFGLTARPGALPLGPQLPLQLPPPSLVYTDVSGFGIGAGSPGFGFFNGRFETLTRQ